MNWSNLFDTIVMGLVALGLLFVAVIIWRLGQLRKRKEDEESQSGRKPSRWWVMPMVVVILLVLLFILEVIGS